MARGSRSQKEELTMIESLQKYWKEAVWIFSVVFIAFTFYSWKVEVEETK